MLKRNVSRHGAVEAMMEVIAIQSVYGDHGVHKQATLRFKGKVDGKVIEVDCLLMGGDTRVLLIMQEVDWAMRYHGSRIEGRKEELKMFFNVKLFNVAKPLWGGRYVATLLEARLTESAKAIVSSLGRVRVDLAV